MSDEDFVDWQCDINSICNCSGCNFIKFKDNWPTFEKINKWNKKRVHYGMNEDE